MRDPKANEALVRIFVDDLRAKVDATDLPWLAVVAVGGGRLWCAYWFALNRPAGVLPDAAFWVADPGFAIVLDLQGCSTSGVMPRARCSLP